MRNLNKKGISDVVAAIVITSLSVMAVYLMWSYFSGFTSTLDSGLSPLPSCLTLKTKLNSVCYNNEKKQIEIEVNAGQEDEINSIRFVSSTETNTADYLCGASSQTDCTSSCSIPAKGETKKIYIDSEEKPSELSIVINGCTFTSINIDNIKLC